MIHSRSTETLKELDKNHLLHPATSIAQQQSDGPRIIGSGKGIRLRDTDGHELIDAIAGLWCVNVGYGREELADSMADAARTLGYYHSFSGMSNPPQIELAAALSAMAPGKLSRVFFGSSGSDANDTLMKIAWHYFALKGQPQKRKIISRMNAYHGTSISTASLTGLPAFHKAFHLPIDGVLHTDCPHFYRYGEPGEGERDYAKRMAAKLEAMILAEGPETVAGFIAEPIMGAGGVIAPPHGYFQEIQAVLKRHNVLMIADEVICGYGRLGEAFGSDVFGIEPDLMATAKGLTSDYFPLSAAFITDEIWDVLKQGSETYGSFYHGYTYSGHPVGAATALANLDIISRERLIENAAKVGAYLHQELQKLCEAHPNIGEVRGRGLLAGVQLIADKEKKTFFDPACKIPARIAEACYRKGLIVRPLPSVTTLAFSPPLIVTEADIDEILGRFEAGLNEILPS